VVGKKIATSFEFLVKKYFTELEETMRKEGIQDVKPTTVSYVSGSVEAACALGLADGIGKQPTFESSYSFSLIKKKTIVDLVESGETMHAAKLHAVGTILKSEAVLICNPKKHKTNPLIETVKRRLEGLIVAQRYVLCNYNIPRSQLSKAIKITPGKKAPSVSPLECADWVAVSSMVTRKSIVDVLDQLEDVGAQDILVFEIKNARMGNVSSYHNDA
jgi:ATP phosphoribosyltransferase